MGAPEFTLHLLAGCGATFFHDSVMCPAEVETSLSLNIFCFPSSECTFDIRWLSSGCKCAAPPSKMPLLPSGWEYFERQLFSARAWIVQRRSPCRQNLKSAQQILLTNNILKVYPIIISSLQTIWREEGLRAFYRSFPTSLVHNMPFQVHTLILKKNCESSDKYVEEKEKRRRRW